MSYVDVGCRVLLAVVFCWSAASKLRSRTAFTEFVRSLRPLTDRAEPAAVVLVAGEVAVPPLLLVAPVWGLSVAWVLLLVLNAGVFFIVRRRLAVRCRCFGAAGQLGIRHLVRNLALLGVATTGLVMAAFRTDTRAAWPGVLLAAGVATVLSTLVIRYDDIIELFQ
jgi:Methylamine utilisation protein MauE